MYRDKADYLPLSVSASKSATKKKVCLKAMIDAIDIIFLSLEQVKEFILSSVHVSQGRKFLLLTGPSGCGKSATVRILAREAGLNLLEWSNPTTTPYNNTFMERGQGSCGGCGCLFLLHSVHNVRVTRFPSKSLSLCLFCILILFL